jgi:tetratricopeptide (TPR) repeat protein
MIRYFSFILSVLIFREISASAQNIFDAEHSVAYAEYLYKTGQFAQAADEYERVIFFCPDSFSYKTKLISAYRKSGQSEKVLSRIEDIFGNKPSIYPQIIACDYLSVLFEKQDTSNISKLLKKNINLENNKTIEFRFGLSMLENNWAKAEKESEKLPIDYSRNPEMKSVLLSAENTKLRNKTLAVSLSAAIPGLGKVYTQNYTDALIVFGIVSVNAWQSWRGFHKEGKTSVYGWIFGSLSAGFYLGNLYGTAKAVKKYNQRKIEEIHEKVIKIIDSD